MSLYHVHFSWKGKEMILKARSLDLTHPYFVSIKGLVFEKGQSILINPAEDDVVNEFGDSEHLMIPFQTVRLIEEVPNEKPSSSVLKLFPDKEEVKEENINPDLSGKD